MPEAGVEFANVSYALASSASGRVLIKDVTLALEAGKTTALLGRSGSGKTTLLRMVNGLVVPTSGRVVVGGKEAGRGMEEQVALRRGIGYVIQETGLFPHMTVERNAGMALELAGQFGALDPMTRAEMQTMLRDLLARVKKTVLLVTHDLDEALYLAERVVFLEGGVVVADLLADEVLESGIPQVKDYVNAVHRAVKR